jgi:NhaP-type Na+/H+ or K+/H+ antiporter
LKTPVVSEYRMAHNILIHLASILVLGVSAQWLAWRLRLPALVVLLAFGLAAGPVTGFLAPDQLLGPLLHPLVSLAVAIILYEGGLSLRLRELHDVRPVVIKLITAGVLITWLGSAAAAWLLLGMDWAFALLLGAILVVTGPTVIGPMLRHLRLGGRVGAVLKWEGIIIDPLGAVLAFLVASFVGSSHAGRQAAEAVGDLARLVVVGTGLGVAGAALVVTALRRYWVPDALHNALSLTVVVVAFTLGNVLQEEAGLLAATLMGVTLANQRWVAIRHLVEFKENLVVLLLSALFIVLAARLSPDQLRSLDFGSLAFLAVLVLVVRPAAVLVATAGSSLGRGERLFLACMAPRGIVAAAVAPVFALNLTAAGDPAGPRLVPVTFLVILGTGVLYGLSAAPLARRLGLAQPCPQGVLFAGANSWARALGAALRAQGCPVLFVDTLWEHVAAARLEGLPTYHGSILAERSQEELDLRDLGRLVALTPREEVNALACLCFTEVFGRREVYQLPFESLGSKRAEAVARDQRGRLLFGPGMTFTHLVERFGSTPVVRATPLTDGFDYAAFQKQNATTALPLAVVRNGGAEVIFFTVEGAPAPMPGDVLLSAVAPAPQSSAASPL